MLSFVQNWLTPKCNPIGVDFGSDCLRMAQVYCNKDEIRLVAAASADVPPHVRHDPAARISFFVESIRDLLAQGTFRGREAVLGLPASSMFVQHLRMPKLEPDAMKKAIPWELRGKLPIDPSNALLRHVIAGDVYEGQEAKTEVVVMAAAKETVNQLLANAAAAKLDVIGMNVEPKALVDCFSQIYHRKSEIAAINCFVDIGCVATRAVIACGSDILFARVIPVGGDHFSRAVGAALKMKMEDAKVLRVQIAQSQVANTDEAHEQPAPPPRVEPGPETSVDNSFALLSAGMEMERRREAPKPVEPKAKAPEMEISDNARAVYDACQEPIRRIVEELELCRRYYETTFPNNPVTRLIFVGGEARQKILCQQIAQQMGLAAQIGDPMVRVGKNSDVGIESGLDVKQPQPGWSVAVGLSIGANVAANATAIAGK